MGEWENGGMGLWGMGGWGNGRMEEWGYGEWGDGGMGEWRNGVMGNGGMGGGAEIGERGVNNFILQMLMILQTHK